MRRLFSLKAGLISIHEQNTLDNAIFDTLPGVEIASFAVNRIFVQKYDFKGLGGILFRQLITPFVKKLATALGIYMVYLFALPQPKLLATYKYYGFQRLAPQDETLLHRRLKSAYDYSCIFMFKPLKEM